MLNDVWLDFISTVLWFLYVEIKNGDFFDKNIIRI